MLSAWALNILTHPAPSDETYRSMSDSELEQLANTRGLYAAKAWAEQARRKHENSSNPHD